MELSFDQGFLGRVSPDDALVWTHLHFHVLESRVHSEKGERSSVRQWRVRRVCRAGLDDAACLSRDFLLLWRRTPIIWY